MIKIHSNDYRKLLEASLIRFEKYEDGSIAPYLDNIKLQVDDFCVSLDAAISSKLNTQMSIINEILKH
jgi:hypothetical protein